MAQDRPNGNGAPAAAQVLKFEPRRRVDTRAGSDPAGAAEVDDLARYEDGDVHIDYRQRMLMNVIAVAIVTVLIGAGVWIADTIAAMQKIQDCAMQGRQNCAPIEVPLKR